MVNPEKPKKNRLTPKMVAVFILIVLALAAVCMMATSCQGFMSGEYPPDNPIEEVAEAALDYYTGFDVDLSPSTPEG